jgi:hypothetical protein
MKQMLYKNVNGFKVPNEHITEIILDKNYLVPCFSSSYSVSTIHPITITEELELLLKAGMLYPNDMQGRDAAKRHTLAYLGVGTPFEEANTDFRNASVGDLVYCLLYGWGHIHLIDMERSDQQLLVKFSNGSYRSYDIDGKEDPNHVNRTLFHNSTTSEQAILNQLLELPAVEVSIGDFVQDNDTNKRYSIVAVSAYSVMIVDPLCGTRLTDVIKVDSIHKIPVEALRLKIYLPNISFIKCKTI